MLHRLDSVEDALAELDAVMARARRPWAHQLELLQTVPGWGRRWRR
jgi:transposase